MTIIPKKKNHSKLRIYFDMFFFSLMVLVLIPQSTGIPIHEWAGFIIIVPFLLHLIINWNWIATNSTQFLKKEANKTRFDYVLNWLLYLSMIAATVSGIVISEAVLPLFGIHFTPDKFWTQIHSLSATLLMAVLGIHIALHWKWIVVVLRNLKLKSDFHNFTEIIVIVRNSAKQFFLLIAISIAISFLFWLLNYSDWANGFRISSDIQTEDHIKSMPHWMMYILPLLKVTIIISIPALLTSLLLKIKQLSKKNTSKSIKQS